MTQQEQRIAVAEWMGWKQIDAYTHTVQWCGRWVEGNPNPVETAVSFPDYAHDLNAMQSALLRLTEEQQAVFVVELSAVCARELKHTSPDFVYGFDLITSASNWQLEALCRTLFPQRFEK